MSALGKVRIGHKAPDFHCGAVIGGIIEDVSLSTFICPSIKPSSPVSDSPWLILMFIPAAFSFVCPTEVLAFQNCLDEFKDRNCNVVFVSVDTKHSLWHWQNVPRQYGGLGPIDIPLLSDATHRLSRDYGVLIEEEGVSLRGMFILDPEGIVQQITLNNLSVGRSVLEALRLLEAFQAVAKHGVLCPIDWKPSSNASGEMNTISNTLTESYDDRLAKLQKEFGDVQVVDLDAKHKYSDGEESISSLQPIVIKETTCEEPVKPSLPRMTSPPTFTASSSSYAAKSFSAPPSANPTPNPTPSTTHPPTLKQSTVAGTARHSRGRDSSFHLNMDQHYVNNLFSNSSKAPSIFKTLVKKVSTPTDSSSGHTNVPFTPPASAKSKPLPSPLAKHNTYESRRGTQVILEFADPTISPKTSPYATPGLPPMELSPPPPPHRSHSQGTSQATSPVLSPAASWNGPLNPTGWTRRSPAPTKEVNATAAGVTADEQAPAGQTRLQATFEAIKKMSSGLTTPKLDHSPRKNDKGKIGKASGGAKGAKSPGYFDVVVEDVKS